jgi:hypothetical protein
MSWSPRCTAGDLPTLAPREQHELHGLYRVPGAQQGNPEEKRQIDQSTLNCLATHSAMGQVLARSLQNQRDPKRGARQPMALRKQAPILDRGDEIGKRLALDQQGAINQVITQRQALDGKRYVFVIAQEIDYTASLLAVVGDDLDR